MSLFRTNRLNAAMPRIRALASQKAARLTRDQRRERKREGEQK